MQKSFFDQKQEPAKVKHLILEKYLRAWAKVIRAHFSQGYYIDAFAGAGEYKEGEEGSPLIAARILAEEQRAGCQFRIICVEKQKSHFQKLQNAIRSLDPTIPIACYLGEFDHYASRIISDVGDAPAFFFIDPCGFDGVEMKTVRKVLSIKHKEVLINFMYSRLSRVASPRSPARPELLDAYFGSQKWRDKSVLEQLQLYIDTLRYDGALTYSFKNLFPDRDQVIYYLIYATRVFRALKIMKDVMRKEESDGQFQLNLFDGLAFRDYCGRIYSLIKDRGRSSHEELLKYTYIKTGSFIESDLRKASKNLEKRGLISITGKSQDKVYIAS